jgi:hypothetical protein
VIKEVRRAAFVPIDLIAAMLLPRGESPRAAAQTDREWMCTRRLNRARIAT